ncbi:hypothetical protein, partial [Flavivirga rizhaonensis]|uniref:hypothetical protein n=1 Tax=Flavivirga rizhaonensis TaxID=2559571 RepID=UPI001B85F31E
SVRIGIPNLALTSWNVNCSFAFTLNNRRLKSSEYDILQDTKNMSNYNDLAILLIFLITTKNKRRNKNHTPDE